jgi:outer membrane receptor protein involved in Fe transport
MVRAQTDSPDLLSQTKSDDKSAADVRTATDIIVTARSSAVVRDPARRGGAVRHLSRHVLENRPGGLDASFRRLLLQIPGVAKDSGSGDDVFIRNEHQGLQYRLNGIIIPESFAAYGALIDDRIADSVDVVTGALLPEYGPRTSGIASFKTLSGKFTHDANISVTGASNGFLRTTASMRDAVGDLNFFISGTYLHDKGEVYVAPGTVKLVRDNADQFNGFGYASYKFGSSSSLTAIGGAESFKYKIPNTALDAAVLGLNRQALFDSSQLDQSQWNQTRFGILAYQYSNDSWDVTISPSIRYAKTRYAANESGNRSEVAGAANDFVQTSLVLAEQADVRWKDGDSHIISIGGYFSHEQVIGRSVNRVFVTDSFSRITGKTTRLIPVRLAITTRTSSAYLQDEWDIADALTFNLGLRYDHFSGQISEEQLSPRANLVWTPTGTTTWHIGYARIFGPPPTDLLGGGILAALRNTTGPFINGTAVPVVAERQHSFDVGVEKDIGALKLSVNSYFKLSDNLIDLQQIGDTLIQTPFNYARGDNWGFEAAASFQRGPFNAYFNLSRGRQKARRVVSNQFLIDAPELDYIANYYIYTDHSQQWTISGGGEIELKDRFGKLTPGFGFDYGSGHGVNRPINSIANSGTYPEHVELNVSVSQAINKKRDPEPTVRFDVIYSAYPEDVGPANTLSIRTDYRPNTTIFVGFRWPL